MIDSLSNTRLEQKDELSRAWEGQFSPAGMLLPQSAFNMYQFNWPILTGDGSPVHSFIVAVNY